jgi:hypothetical protein
LILVDVAGVLHRTVYAEFLSRLGAQRATGVYPADAPWFTSFVRSILTRVESIPFSSKLVLGVAPMRERLLRGDPIAIGAYALVEHDFSEALRAIKSPTLVIWGSEDKIASLRTAQLAAAIIAGARLTIIDGAGHEPMLQKPEQFNAIVQDELRGRLEAPPYALQKAAIGSERVGRCNGRRGEHFSGDYGRLSLKDCPDAQITNARVGLLEIAGSTVRIVNSQIRDGVEAKNSRLELTAGVVGGSPALALDASSVDAAGTRFESDGAIAENRGAVPVMLYLSVSEVARANATPRYAHDVIRLRPKQRW